MACWRAISFRSSVTDAKYRSLILTFINEKCIHALKQLHNSIKNKNNSKATENINKKDMSKLAISEVLEEIHA
jgi:flagellin-specific chaperone FliS